MKIEQWSEKWNEWGWVLKGRQVHVNVVRKAYANGGYDAVIALGFPEAVREIGEVSELYFIASLQDRTWETEDQDIEIVTWFTDPHDTDLGDIFTLLNQSQGNNYKLLDHKVFDENGDTSIVVWSGNPNATDDELRTALKEESGS